MAHTDADGFWVGDYDGEYDEKSGLYWHEETKSWGDAYNSDAVMNVLYDVEELDNSLQNPGPRMIGIGGLSSQADSPALPFGDIAGVGIAGWGLYLWVTWAPQPVRPYTSWIDTISRRNPITIPYILAKKDELKLIDHIADKFGIDRDVLSDEIHDYKKGTGRGGKDNLSKEKIEKIAKKIKDSQGNNDQ